MDILELEMLTFDQINFEALPKDTLVTLASGDDPFTATSAIGELENRQSKLAAPVAKNLLFGSKADRYLLAAVLEVLFNTDRPTAIQYTLDHVTDCDAYALNSMLQIVWGDEDVFKSGPAMAVVGLLLDRLDRLDEEETEQIKAYVREAFLKLDVVAQCRLKTATK